MAVTKAKKEVAVAVAVVEKPAAYVEVKAAEDKPDFSAQFQMLSPMKQRAYATVRIDTNSHEGRAVLENVIGTALQKAGFTNVVASVGYERSGEKFVEKAPETVLDALMARNPAFLNTKIDINSVNHMYMPNIAPDSEYPCNGRPITGYKEGGYPGNIVAVDEDGVEQHVGNVVSDSYDTVLAALNATVKK